jgi:hypothetical protein
MASTDNRFLLTQDPLTAHVAPAKAWKQIWVKKHQFGALRIFQTRTTFALLADRHHDLWVVAIDSDFEALKAQSPPIATMSYPSCLMSPCVPYIVRFARSWSARSWVGGMGGINTNHRVLQELIEGLRNGLSPNYEYDGKSLIHHAVGGCPENEHMVRILVSEGANINKKHNGHTPLMTAIHGCYHQCVFALLDLGAKVDTVGRDGQTALHWAVTMGTQQAAQLLIDAGARMDIPNKQGQTAVDIDPQWGAWFAQYQLVSMEKSTMSAQMPKAPNIRL